MIFHLFEIIFSTDYFSNLLINLFFEICNLLMIECFIYLKGNKIRISQNISWKDADKCLHIPLSKSSRPEVFCKKDVLRNFAKFTGKNLYQSFFINKVAVLTPVTLLKKTPAHVFSCEFCEISKNTISYRTPPMAASREIQLTPIASVVA